MRNKVISHSVLLIIIILIPLIANCSYRLLLHEELPNNYTLGLYSEKQYLKKKYETKTIDAPWSIYSCKLKYMYTYRNYEHASGQYLVLKNTVTSDVEKNIYDFYKKHKLYGKDKYEIFVCVSYYKAIYTDTVYALGRKFTGKMDVGQFNQERVKVYYLGKVRNIECYQLVE